MDPRVISSHKRAAVVCFFLSAVGEMVQLFYALISIHMQNIAFNGCLPPCFYRNGPRHFKADMQSLLGLCVSATLPSV